MTLPYTILPGLGLQRRSLGDTHIQSTMPKFRCRSGFRDAGCTAVRDRQGHAFLRIPLCARLEIPATQTALYSFLERQRVSRVLRNQNHVFTHPGRWQRRPAVLLSPCLCTHALSTRSTERGAAQRGDGGTPRLWAALHDRPDWSWVLTGIIRGAGVTCSQGDGVAPRWFRPERLCMGLGHTASKAQS